MTLKLNESLATLPRRSIRESLPTNYRIPFLNRSKPTSVFVNFEDFFNDRSRQFILFRVSEKAVSFLGFRCFQCNVLSRVAKQRSHLDLWIRFHRGIEKEADDNRHESWLFTARFYLKASRMSFAINYSDCCLFILISLLIIIILGPIESSHGSDAKIYHEIQIALHMFQEAVRFLS